MSYAEPNDQVTGSAAYGDTAAVPVLVPVQSTAPLYTSNTHPTNAHRDEFKSSVNATSSSTRSGIDSAADSANYATDRAASKINAGTDVAADKANQASAYGQEKADQARGYANDKANQAADNVNYASNVAADKANHAANVTADKANQATAIASDKVKQASASIQSTAQTANEKATHAARTANEKAAQVAQVARENLTAAGQQAQVGLQQVQGKVVDLAQQAANHPAVHNATVEVGKQIDGLDRELSKYPLLNDLSAQTHIPKIYLLGAVALPLLLTISFNIFGLASPLTNAIGWGIPAWLSVRALEKEGSSATHPTAGTRLDAAGVPGGYKPGEGYSGVTGQGSDQLGSSSSSPAPRGSDKQWLTYWIVFGYLNLLESFALRPLLYYVPYYFLFKLAAIFYLASPSIRGAEKLFYTVVRPTYRHLSARARAAQNSGSYGLKPQGTSAPSANATQTAQQGYNAARDSLNSAASRTNTDSYGSSGYSTSGSGLDSTGLTQRSIGERNNNPFVGGQAGVAVVEAPGVVGGPTIVY